AAGEAAGATSVQIDEEHPLPAAVPRRRVHHGDGADVLGRNSFGEPFRRGDGRLPEAPAAEGSEEDVLGAPYHALGHARRATRVEEIEVVAGAGAEVALGRGGPESVLVRHGVGVR